MVVDTALLFAVAYGVFMGSYPVPIKTRAVLEADVHPLIFQSFKSFWVFVTGFLALIPVYASHRSFEFTWWGVASAASWVPSGFCTICGVTYIGRKPQRASNPGLADSDFPPLTLLRRVSDQCR